MDKVVSITVPGVFEDLTILANINGKQALYRQRIIDSCKPPDDDSVKGPVYFLSEPGTVRIRDDVFGGENHEQVLEFSTDFDCRNGKRGLPAFFETRYIFRVQCAENVKDVRIYHRLALVTEGFTFAGGWLFGDIDFINTPGRFTLALDVTFKDGSTRRVSFQFMVVSVKMDVEEDYKKILFAIEKERPGLVQNFLSKTFGDSGFDAKKDSSRPEWYAILESIFDFYVSAVKQVVDNPHRRYEAVAEWRRPDQIKRWSPALVNRYKAIPADRREMSWLRVERIEAEVDTQENRFVLHTVRDIARGLNEFAEVYRLVEGISRECLEGVGAQVRLLEELAAHPFFRGVGRYKGGGAQSLVLQKRAGYAQILAAWLTLKQALTPEGKGIDIGYRPLSALYEFWTFLTTRDILRNILVRDQGYEMIDDPKIDDLEHLLDTDEESSGTRTKSLCRMGYRFVKGTRTVSLAYQQTYGTDESSENFAITYDQRPDIVLSIKESDDPDANVYTYLFDAKYRVDELGGKDASPRDAIDDMHRYRDAILYRRQKAGLRHEIIGAYVLFPGRLGQTYEYETMREQENIGAFPLLPKTVYEQEFEKFLLGLLGKGSKKDHLSKSIPPRGAELSLDPVITDEMVLVVSNLSFVQTKSYIDNKCYVCLRRALSKTPEFYRRIRFTHSGNADMFVDVADYAVGLKQYLGSFPGEEIYGPTDELVKFTLMS